MATFDTLIEDLASRFGLGANARLLVKEILSMISSSPGGLGGFLDKFKLAGLSSEVATWVGRPDAAPVPTGQIERALGPTALSGIASRLGLGQGAISTALGYALPKIVGLLTPGGVVPAGVPAEVTGFLAQPRAGAAESGLAAPRRVDVYPASAQDEAGVRRWLWPALAALVVVTLLSYFWSTLNRMPSAPPVAKAPEPAAPSPPAVAQAPSPPPAPSPVVQAPAPPPPPAAQAPSPPPPPAETQAAAPPPPPPPTEAQATPPQASPPAAPPAPSTEAQATPPQASPPPAAQAPAAESTSSPPKTEQAPANPAPAPVATAETTAAPSAAKATRLALSREGDVARASGIVRDEEAKSSILDALNTVFGADKVKSDISIDQNAASPSWLGNFRPAIEALKGANVDAVFNGDKVSVGGSAMDNAARDKIIDAVKSALGASVTVGALTDRTAAAVAMANDRATTELASLQSGFGVKDLLFALNDSVVNFASDSAEVPESMTPFLKTAAADLKQLKAGHVLEIAGYTDNTGDAALNLALSQKRAEAVREALIKYGADADMLVAKGYGAADPIASNNTPEGRERNRRIEYHVVKAPT
jgi:OmpA-OmpF porin, OOP family